MSAVKDTSRRVLVTLALLVAYRFGFTVPAPGLSPEFLNSQRDQGSLFGLMSAISGGAFGQTSIFALGLLPYLGTALLVRALVRFSPDMSALRDGSDRQRAQLEVWTRVFSAAIALVCSAWMYVAIFHRHPEMIEEWMRGSPILVGALVALSLTTGAMLVAWISDLITRDGLGSGPLVVVIAGVLARVPHALNQLPPEEFWSTMLRLLAGLFAAVVIAMYVWLGTRTRTR
jgi:preprotein translocase subunit SecY